LAELAQQKKIVREGIDTSVARDPGLVQAFKNAGKSDAEIEAWFARQGGK